MMFAVVQRVRLAVCQSTPRSRTQNEMNRRVRPRIDVAIRGLVPALFWLFFGSSNPSLGQPNPWPGDYRHVHKPQLNAIVEGDYDGAIVESDKILKTHPHDAESLFFKAIAISNRSVPTDQGKIP